jgi:hypothetical protein
MACANKTSSAFFPELGRLNHSAFMRAINLFFDALKEALEMRRAAHKSCPFSNE